MNVKEFKEWLDQFDDDVIVQVGVQQRPDDYQAYGEVLIQTFQGFEDEDYTYYDFTNNKFVKEDSPNYNKKYLELGMGD